MGGQMNELKSRKDNIESILGEKKAEQGEMKAQLGKMKKSMGYTNEADIDTRIATIEFKLWTDSISLKEEKQLLAEIKELKKCKPKLSELSKLQNNVESFDKGSDLRSERTKLIEQMQLCFEKKKAIQERFSECNDKRKNQVGD